ncbi:MAG: KH domain-containing protein [Coriobacteriales bacterium]|nr:KH domain-containing protein [Coriobacteriales bacterium]
MTERTADLDELVRYVFTSLVDSPDDVKIERSESDGRVSFEVTVAADDVGKVIGRQGRIIKAIRTLARAAGSLDGRDVDVEVLG